MGYAGVQRRVQSASTSHHGWCKRTIENLFSFLFAYLGTHTTVWQGDVYYNNNDMPNFECATRCLIVMKGSGEPQSENTFIILKIF